MKNVAMDKTRSGFILGAFLGTLHLVWSVLVAVGFAQVILDFIYKIHFLNNPFIIQDFNLGNAALLVLVTTLVGFVAGCLLALLWNLMKK